MSNDNDFERLWKLEAFCNKMVLDGVRTAKSLANILQAFKDGSVVSSFDKAHTHIIDCDADPFLPDGWKVEEHHKGGKWQWNPSKVSLHLSTGQIDGEKFVGFQLRKELAHLIVLNTCVLSYLLVHPELIPESWKVDEDGKTRYIIFWGTIFFDAEGLSYVQSLYWDGINWSSHYNTLRSRLNRNYPAAVLAS